MTFREAMEFIRDHEEEYSKVRRSIWDRHLGVNYFYHYACDAANDEFNRVPTMWDLDNGQGSTSGSYWIYKATPEDIEATDWEIYDPSRLFADNRLEEVDAFPLDEGLL